MAHTFNPSTQEAEAGRALSSRPACSTEQVSGQPGLQRCSVLKNKKTSKHTNKQIEFKGWRDSSELNSTDCSSRDPEFDSQQLHCGSQPSTVRMSSFGIKEYMQIEISYIYSK